MSKQTMNQAGVLEDGKTLFLNDRENGKDEWLTPPEIIRALGPFDLDPCAPVRRPWPMANEHYTVEDNGLLKEWRGFVWCNPPYGDQAKHWLARMAEHNHGILLIFARTETRQFFDYVWGRAEAILFIKGRLTFYHVDGTKGGNSGGAPSVLAGYGSVASERLRLAAQNGTVPGFYAPTPRKADND